MKKLHIIGIVVTIALIIFGATLEMPRKYLSVSSSSKAYDYDWSENRGAEYVGGDAYNYQMEASLKAGYVAGVMSVKAITITGGALLLCLTIFSYIKCACVDKQTAVIEKQNAAIDAQIAKLSEMCMRLQPELAEATEIDPIEDVQMPELEN